MAKSSSPTKPSKRAEPSPIVKTIAEAARRLKVDEATIKNWRRHGCPGETGKYDVDAMAAWRAANRKPQRAAPSDLTERARWETVKTRAEAKLRQLALKAKRGELIEVDRAAQVFRQHLAEVITHLDQLPDYAVAGQQLPPKARQTMRERLKSKIREMRRALEKSLADLARRAKRDSEDDGDSE